MQKEYVNSQELIAFPGRDPDVSMLAPMLVYQAQGCCWDRAGPHVAGMALVLILLGRHWSPCCWDGAGPHFAGDGTGAHFAFLELWMAVLLLQAACKPARRPSSRLKLQQQGL